MQSLCKSARIEKLQAGKQCRLGLPILTAEWHISHETSTVAEQVKDRVYTMYVGPERFSRVYCSTSSTSMPAALLIPVASGWGLPTLCALGILMDLGFLCICCKC